MFSGESDPQSDIIPVESRAVLDDQMVQEDGQSSAENRTPNHSLPYGIHTILFFTTKYFLII